MENSRNQKPIEELYHIAESIYDQLESGDIPGMKKGLSWSARIDPYRKDYYEIKTAGFLAFGGKKEAGCGPVHTIIG